MLEKYLQIKMYQQKCQSSEAIVRYIAEKNHFTLKNHAFQRNSVLTTHMWMCVCSIEWAAVHQHYEFIQFICEKCSMYSIIWSIAMQCHASNHSNCYLFDSLTFSQQKAKASVQKNDAHSTHKIENAKTCSQRMYFCCLNLQIIIVLMVLICVFFRLSQNNKITNG